MTTVVASTVTLDVEQFKQVLPEKMRKSISPQIMKTVNDMLSDPDMCEAYRENLIGYTGILNDGKFKIDNYVFAVKYVSFKLMGHTNLEAYTKTFPDKMDRWQKTGVSSKDMSSYISIYNKSKLVQGIMEQSMIPTHVLNADILQKAINIQLDLAMNASSEKVRSDAANSLMTHLKAPEKTKLQIETTSAGSQSAIAELRKNVELMRDTQLAMIAGGQMTAQQIAERRMVFSESEAIDGEVVQ